MSKHLLIGEFEIEPATRRLRRRNGELVHLANRPFQVLLHLVANRERLVSRAELLEKFWDGRDVYEDALTRCVSTVRKALDDQGGRPLFIETRWAEGYRFVGPCHAIESPPPLARVRSAGRFPVRSGRRHASVSSTTQFALAAQLLRRGNAYLSRSGHRSHRYALEMFRQAITLNPDDPRAHGGLAASHALVYLHAEPTEAHRIAATSAARNAMELGSLSAEAQLGRALVAMMHSDHVEADTAFSQAESLEPGQFHAWYYHGRRCAERSDHEAAATLFARASASDPFDYQALALAEQSFRRMGLRAEANRGAQACADVAELVLKRRPDDVRALSLGGCVLPTLNRGAESRGWTERAVALEPDEPFVNLNAACVFVALGEYDRAFTYLERVPLSAQGNCNWIAHDPALDPVRSHARFQAMMQRAAS